MKWKVVIGATSGIALIGVAYLWYGSSSTPTAPPLDEGRHTAVSSAASASNPATLTGETSATPAAPAAPPPRATDAPDSDPGNESDTRDVAAAPADMSRPSEQFMHSRRDDGQHSE